MGHLYRAECCINAPIDLVWDVLTDFEQYAVWNPFTIEVKTSRRVGQPVELKVLMGRNNAIDQTEELRVYEPESWRLVWGATVFHSFLIRAQRAQWLEPVGGGCRYVTEDLIEGRLAWLVEMIYGDRLRTGFSGVASGLKARAEALAS